MKNKSVLQIFGGEAPKKENKMKNKRNIKCRDGKEN
jgi:hypothetical protein